MFGGPACHDSLGKHLNTQDRQGPSLLALLNGPVDPRGGANIFWAGPHGSNYVYKVRGACAKRTDLRRLLLRIGEVIFYLSNDET